MSVSQPRFFASARAASDVASAAAKRGRSKVSCRSLPARALAPSTMRVVSSARCSAASLTAATQRRSRSPSSEVASNSLKAMIPVSGVRISWANAANTASRAGDWPVPPLLAPGLEPRPGGARPLRTARFEGLLPAVFLAIHPSARTHNAMIGGRRTDDGGWMTEDRGQIRALTRPRGRDLLAQRSRGRREPAGPDDYETGMRADRAPPGAADRGP